MIIFYGQKSERYTQKRKIVISTKIKNQGQFLLTKYIGFARKTGTLMNKKKREYWNGIDNLSEMWGNNQ